ncbi:heterokaryon incompatibility protein-domain-containing protein [Dactylonectria macrodidyma]|uniref:Heterokaryon incompatibility protein-domain-containing protein n=1 Tax=Dactylonectria macrodidyma TaxID=307937 RepID=A0A9P9E7W8_9HYPO|nr:heterokaryon incompatibility protein-domain-containing protein [Dactylonectria macrodidyma]
MSSGSESSPMGPGLTPGLLQCPNCSPRKRRNDLAPSPISFQGGGYSFFGAVAKLQESECDQCAVIASGVLHFARMFRSSGDASPDNISVECDSLQKRWDWGARPDPPFPDEVGISFRFIDMPERGKIQLQVVASSNAFNHSRDLKAQTEESLTVIEGWVEKCLKSHGNRCSYKGAANLPSRLLEINKQEVRLVETENLKAHHWSLRRPPKALHYIALSHCWGCEATNTKTMASNIASMLKGIPVNTLPKSFQDAIVITLRLGYHLLWIDSLCIIQDDDDDWQRESARMADIYENAVLTIAATRSPDGHGGCFSTVYESPYIWRRMRRFQPTGSNDDTEQPVLVHHPDLWRPFEAKRDKFARWFVLRPGHDIRDLSHKGNYGENATDVVTVGYPLLSRAWFFQERLLSSRVVHFGYTELSWECCSTFWLRSFGAEFRREDDRQRHSQHERYPIEKTRRMFISLITDTSSSQYSRSNQHGITNPLFSPKDFYAFRYERFCLSVRKVLLKLWDSTPQIFAPPCKITALGDYPIRKRNCTSCWSGLTPSGSL